MYLLNITNIDYVMMTILFGAIFASAYYFRRKNRSSHDFFLGASATQMTFFSGAISLGIVEFISLSGYGAYAGLSGLMLFMIVYIVLDLLAGFRLKNSTLYQRLQVAEFSAQSVVILVIYALLMLFVAGTGIAVMVSMLKSLLGWEFANSTLSLIAIAAVCLILGGGAGLSYSKILASVIVFLLLLVIAGLSYKNIGFGNLVASLQSVATDNKLQLNSFTSIAALTNPMLQLWLMVIVSLTFIVINPFANLKQIVQKTSGTIFIAKIIKFIMIAIIIFTGVFALATPNKLPEIAGKKIITTQTRFDNGELGYVVRAVPGDGVTLQRGVIPVKAADDDDQTLSNSTQGNFDYISSALVVIKKALPYAFIPLFIIVLFFFKTVSDSILFATFTIINGIYAPRFNKSGEDLENLWAARVFMFALFVIAICIGLVLFKFFSFYYMFCLIFILSTPVACALILNNQGGWFFDIIVYLLILVLLLTANISGTPALIPLVKYPNLADMTAKITLFASIAYFSLSLLSKLCTKNR